MSINRVTLIHELLTKDENKKSYDSTKSIPYDTALCKFHKERFEKALKDVEELFPYVKYLNYIKYFRIAIFGSARLTSNDSDAYQLVRDIIHTLGKKNPQIDVVTGGATGVMEAANEGLALAAKDLEKKHVTPIAKNHGVRIELPFEEKSNDHLHFKTMRAMFGLRLQDFICKTQGSYNAPGGIGTLLEKVFLLQLKQIGHLEEPYIILAHPEWKKVFDVIYDTLFVKRQTEGRIPTVNEDDLTCIKYSDNIDEIVDIFDKAYQEWFNNVHRHLVDTRDFQKKL